MKRIDHEIMIEQNNSYTIIRLMDKEESKDGKFVSGTWQHTGKSYNDQEIKFTSDNPQYYYWEWHGPHAGAISIGTKMGRGSHKAGEETMFQVLINLLFARRMANGKFQVGGVLPNGGGLLTYNVKPHFFAGPILWSPTQYER